MRCFLCKADGIIQQFTKKTYEKCCLILMFRRKYDFKYGDVRLDGEIGRSHGYHSSCYKKLMISVRLKSQYEQFCKSQQTSDVLLVPPKENPPLTAGDLSPASPVLVQQQAQEQQQQQVQEQQVQEEQQQQPSIIITVNPENPAQEPPSNVLVATLPQTVAFIPVGLNDPPIVTVKIAAPVSPTTAVLTTTMQQPSAVPIVPQPSVAFIPMELSVPNGLVKAVSPTRGVSNRAKKPPPVKMPIPPKPPAAVTPVKLRKPKSLAKTAPPVPPATAVLNLAKEPPSEVPVAPKLPPVACIPVKLSEPTGPTKTALPVSSPKAILNLVKEPPATIISVGSSEPIGPAKTATPVSLATAGLNRAKEPPPSEVSVAMKSPATIIPVELSEPTEPTKTAPPVSRKTTPSMKRMKCIICGCMEKRVEKRRTWVIFPSSQEILLTLVKKAQILKDTRIMENLEGKELVPYHEYCYDVYLKRVEPTIKLPEKPEPFKELHANSFNTLSLFITQEVIKKRKIVYLEDLLLRYKAILLDFGIGEVTMKDFDDYKIDSLERKLRSAFRDRITIQSSTLPHQKKIVFMRGMNATRFIKEVAKLESSHKNAVIELIGSELRNAVVTAETQKVPDKNSIDIFNGDECEISQELMEFMTEIIVDPTIHNLEKDDITELKSVCSELIYAATEGKVKPSRELSAGLIEDLPENPMFKMLDQYSPSVDCNKSSKSHGKMNNSGLQQVNPNNKRRAEVEDLPNPLAFKKQCSSESTVDN